MDELLRRPDLKPELGKELASAARLVSRVETEVLRADQLHKAHRSSLLPIQEWLELSFLADRQRKDAGLNRAELHARLGRLLGSGGLAEADQDTVRGLHRRLAAAQQYGHASDSPFECISRYIEAALPGTSGTSLKVQSRIVPGAAFGVHFSDRYPRAGPLEQTLCERHTHVPDLVLTSLTNAKGQLLYSGINHGVVPSALSGEVLRRLHGRELRTMIEALLLPGNAARTIEISPTRRHAPKSPPKSPGALVAGYASEVHRSETTAEHLGAHMRREARRVTGDETLAAALFADPDKLRRALEGQTVELNPLSIVLVTQKDIDHWHGHRPDFLEWRTRTGPFGLSVRGPGGEPREVRVQLTGCRHQFVILPDESELALDTPTALENRKAVEWLLGLGRREEEPGALTNRVAAMRARVAELRQDLVASPWQGQGLSDASGAVDRRLLIADHRLVQRTEEAELLARSARALEQAGRQLQAIGMQASDWPLVIPSGGRVAPLIALAAHLMGMLPMVSCVSDENIAERVDAEIKFLAAVTDSQNGQLPPANLNREVWGAVRGAFSSR